MKPLITTIAIVAMTLIGSTPKAEARNHHPHGYATSIYISGYRSCGTPIYTERYLIGYNRCGMPIWGYRIVSGPYGYVAPILPSIRYQAVRVCPPSYPHYKSGGSGRSTHYRR